ncbi:MAG: thiosulfate oxidation carrier protein SoxY [Betaproteobacteria bacterium]
MKRTTLPAFQTARRRLVVAVGLACTVPTARGQTAWPAIPALAALLGSRALQTGRVNIEIPKLADNGNSVPLVVTVDSPMSAQDRVAVLHVFSERNPRPRIASITLGPDVGRAQISTRIRLAGTQHIVAVAEMADGTLWGAVAEVIVTQSACVDEP